MTAMIAKCTYYGVPYLEFSLLFQQHANLYLIIPILMMMIIGQRFPVIRHRPLIRMRQRAARWKWDFGVVLIVKKITRTTPEVVVADIVSMIVKRKKSSIIRYKKEKPGAYQLKKWICSGLHLVLIFGDGTNYRYASNFSLYSFRNTIPKIPGPV